MSGPSRGQRRSSTPQANGERFDHPVVGELTIAYEDVADGSAELIAFAQALNRPPAWFLHGNDHLGPQVGGIETKALDLASDNAA